MNTAFPPRRLAKILVYALAFLSCAGAALGQSTLVFPNGTANVEGNSFSADLFRTTGSQYQQVYAASAFPNAPTNIITGMAFRFDGPTAQAFGRTWPGISVFVSTTTSEPDSLSPSFSSNAGSDEVNVYGGPLTIFSAASGSPRSFDVVIPFSTPFFYQPSRGNLSVFMVTAPGITNLVLDGVFASGDSVGRVFGDVAAIGTQDTFGLVTRFDVTVVPEPSTYALAFLAAVMGFFFLKRSSWRAG